MSHSTHIITLGAGCFWCVQAVFEWIDGVIAVECGYCNGDVQQPTYEQVCTGTTGHAEVVRISFDKNKISLQEILEIFFATHDPTTDNQQGNDVGPQYRSGIYTHNAEQNRVAHEVQARVSTLYGNGIVTEIVPEKNYSRAEEYHQHYFEKHPSEGYCAFVIIPKLKKLHALFKSRIKKNL